MIKHQSKAVAVHMSFCAELTFENLPWKRKLILPFSLWDAFFSTNILKVMYFNAIMLSDTKHFLGHKFTFPCTIGAILLLAQFSTVTESLYLFTL